MTVCPCSGCDAHEGKCPEFVQSGRCDDCARVKDARRGRRQARGYGKAHDDRRAVLLAMLRPGAPCPVCGQGMYPHQELDAAHSVDLRADPDAVADHLEHSGCNRGWRGRA